MDHTIDPLKDIKEQITDLSHKQRVAEQCLIKIESQNGKIIEKLGEIINQPYNKVDT